MKVHTLVGCKRSYQTNTTYTNLHLTSPLEIISCCYTFNNSSVMRANLLWHLPKNNTQKHCLTLYYFFALTFFRSPQLELISQSKIIQMKSNEIAFKSNPIYLIKFDSVYFQKKKSLPPNKAVFNGNYIMASHFYLVYSETRISLNLYCSHCLVQQPIK